MCKLIAVMKITIYTYEMQFLMQNLVSNVTVRFWLEYNLALWVGEYILTMNTPTHSQRKAKLGEMSTLDRSSFNSQLLISECSMTSIMHKAGVLWASITRGQNFQQTHFLIPGVRELAHLYNQKSYFLKSFNAVDNLKKIPLFGNGEF